MKKYDRISAEEIALVLDKDTRLTHYFQGADGATILNFDKVADGSVTLAEAVDTPRMRMSVAITDRTLALALIKGLADVQLQVEKENN